MKVILTAWGTSGDVDPMAAIGLALQSQGVEVVLFTNPFFAEKLSNKGLTVEGFGEEWDPSELVTNDHWMHPQLGGIRVWNGLFLPRVEFLYKTLESYLKDNPVNLVLNHIWCFGGYFAARAASVPTGFVGMAPTSWFSAEEPIYAGPTRSPRWFRRWAMKGPVRTLMNLTMGRSLDKACKALNIDAPPRAFFQATQQSDCNYGLWSPLLRGPAQDDPVDAQIVGFPRGTKPPAPLDPKLLSFLEAGEAPVILGLGSALPPLAPDIYRHTLQACRDLNQRVVLVGGDDTLVESGCQDALVVPYAPYRSLFPHAKVIIHHGGIGTLAEAMYTGCPTLQIPFANDQFDNAFRSEDLGVARVVPRVKVNLSRLRNSLNECITSEEMKTKALQFQEQLQHEPCGAEQIALNIQKQFS